MSLGIEIHVAANTAQFTKNISKVGKQSKQAAQQMQSSIPHATSQASRGMNNLTQHAQKAKEEVASMVAMFNKNP